MDRGAPVVETAFAKVNLFLEVHRRREDGYHDLETVMHEIDLADRLELEHSDGDAELRCDDPGLTCGPDNLVMKALRALESRVGRSLPTRFTLRKVIPAGAGLGGGSSDAAAALRGLARLHGLDLAPAELEEVAGRFGSDTAFFVRGGTALCLGRGEIVHPLPHREDLRFVLVFPGLHMATGPVFGALRLTAEKRDRYAFEQRYARGEASRGLRPTLFNRLEEPARAVEGAVDALLRRLAPEEARLSGSGSTIFLLCEDDAEAATLAERIADDTGLVTRAVRSAPARRAD